MHRWVIKSTCFAGKDDHDFSSLLSGGILCAQMGGQVNVCLEKPIAVWAREYQGWVWGGGWGWPDREMLLAQCFCSRHFCMASLILRSS